MKSIHILYDFSQSSGGGKSFLASLKAYFEARGEYAEDVNHADIILLNSHNHLTEALKLKKQHGNTKTFLHRIDGPMRVYNHAYDERDYKVKFILENIANGAVFQSQWSYENHVKLYGQVKVPFRIIHNAVSPKLFYSEPKSEGRKIRIIGSSWSHQKNKGGDYYAYLDQNLDFDKFEVSFVGKTSHTLSNIKCLGVLDQSNLAKELRKFDLFFFPSLYEACSNALLEGIASGLIPLVRAGSSNLEIVTDPRLQFSSYQEAISKLNELNLKTNYNFLNPNLEAVAKQYSEFAFSLTPKAINSYVQVRKLKLHSQQLACRFKQHLFKL